MDEDDFNEEEGEPSGSASAEREAAYPDQGFALVEIDLLKPPGEALTVLEQSLLLSELSLPPASEVTDYVIYDPDGHSYDQSTLEAVRDRAEAGQIDAFLEEIQGEDMRDRRLALFGLTLTGADAPGDCLDAIPLLSSELQVSDADVQAAVLTVLRRIAADYPEQVTPVADEIVSLLDLDTHPFVRAEAVRLVSTIAERDPGSVVDAAPKLAALLHEDHDAQEAAIVSLKHIGDVYPDAVVPAVPDLIRYLEEGADSHRIGAIAVLGTLSKAYPNVAEETIPTAIDLLDADHNRIRANAAGLLADLSDEYPDQIRPCIPTVIDLLSDTDEKARYNATSILAKIAKTYPEDVEPAIGPLIEALDAEFRFARENACWALGYLEADRAEAALRERKRNDPVETVRDTAEWALHQIERGD
jgi:hypothetical protein